MNGSSLETPLLPWSFMEVFVSVEWAMGGLLLNFYATLPANKTNISLFYRLLKTCLINNLQQVGTFRTISSPRLVLVPSLIFCPSVISIPIFVDDAEPWQMFFFLNFTEDASSSETEQDLLFSKHFSHRHLNIFTKLSKVLIFFPTTAYQTPFSPSSFSLGINVWVLKASLKKVPWAACWSVPASQTPLRDILSSNQSSGKQDRKGIVRRRQKQNKE